MAPGCQGPGGGRDDLAFTAGIITFHDPGPVAKNARRQSKRLPPTSIVLTTWQERGETVVEEFGVISSRGRVTAGESVRDRLARTMGRHRKQLTQKEFGELWRHLVEVGILDLPRHPEAFPPDDTAWIQVLNNDRQMIFLKPVAGYRQRRTAQERALTQTWHLSKVLIFNSANS